MLERPGVFVDLRIGVTYDITSFNSSSTVNVGAELIGVGKEICIQTCNESQFSHTGLSCNVGSHVDVRLSRFHDQVVDQCAGRDGNLDVGYLMSAIHMVEGLELLRLLTSNCGGCNGGSSKAGANVTALAGILILRSHIHNRVDISRGLADLEDQRVRRAAVDDIVPA